MMKQMSQTHKLHNVSLELHDSLTDQNQQAESATNCITTQLSFEMVAMHPSHYPCPEYAANTYLEFLTDSLTDQNQQD